MPFFSNVETQVDHKWKSVLKALGLTKAPKFNKAIRIAKRLEEEPEQNYADYNTMLFNMESKIPRRSQR